MTSQNITPFPWEWKFNSTAGNNFLHGSDGEIVGRKTMDRNLQSAAPELFEACEEAHHAIDILFARLIEKDPTFFPSKSGEPWAALLKVNAVLNKANNP